MGGKDLRIPVGSRRVPLLVPENLPDKGQDTLAENPLVPRRAGDVRGVTRVRLVQAAELVGRRAQGYPSGHNPVRLAAALDGAGPPIPWLGNRPVTCGYP